MLVELRNCYALERKREVPHWRRGRPQKYPVRCQHWKGDPRSSACFRCLDGISEARRRFAWWLLGHQSRSLRDPSKSACRNGGGLPSKRIEEPHFAGPLAANPWNFSAAHPFCKLQKPTPVSTSRELRKSLQQGPDHCRRLSGSVCIRKNSGDLRALRRTPSRAAIPESPVRFRRVLSLRLLAFRRTDSCNESCRGSVERTRRCGAIPVPIVATAGISGKRCRRRWQD